MVSRTRAGCAHTRQAGVVGRVDWLLLKRVDQWHVDTTRPSVASRGLARGLARIARPASVRVIERDHPRGIKKMSETVPRSERGVVRGEGALRAHRVKSTAYAPSSSNRLAFSSTFAAGQRSGQG